MGSERDDMLVELEQWLAQVGRRLSAEDTSLPGAGGFAEFGASGKVWSNNSHHCSDVTLAADRPSHQTISYGEEIRSSSFRPQSRLMCDIKP
jgi:hypothetical protein